MPDRAPPTSTFRSPASRFRIEVICAGRCLLARWAALHPRSVYVRRDLGGGLLGYWDFGTIDGVSYSYARDLAAAGFPTFAIDEIGTGRSSHPLSTQITVAVAAYVEHEIVQDLRDGGLDRTRFGRVVDVGHSLGSLTSWLEAATYHDVAGVIVTGAVHDTTVFSQNVLLPTFYPAVDDPAFTGSGLDGGAI